MASVKVGQRGILWPNGKDRGPKVLCEYVGNLAAEQLEPWGGQPIGHTWYCHTKEGAKDANWYFEPFPEEPDATDKVIIPILPNTRGVEKRIVLQPASKGYLELDIQGQGGSLAGNLDKDQAIELVTALVNWIQDHE